MKHIAFLFALAASVAAFAATATKARFGDLGMNAQVVTNVDFSGLSMEETDPTVPSWAKSENKPTYSWSEITSKPSFKTVATTGAYGDLTGKPSIPSTAADIGAASASDVSTLSQNVSTMIGYLQGDDVKVVITNYDSAVEMPAASFQQKITDNGTNYWRTIWSELTRWSWFLPIIGAQTNAIWNALDQKADRAWGFYDSHSGLYAPNGYTWLSSPKIAIAAGLAYQRTITPEGAVWVLESNGLVTETGGNMTNGLFRIGDDEGNSIFEIVKGDRRTVGALAGSVTTETVMGITHLHITYAVVSESHPTLQICTSLTTADWKSETEGAYVAEVWGKTAQSSMFVKGMYELGGETYIRHKAPISADSGIYCTDGFHKVCPVYNNGTITWEVMP